MPSRSLASARLAEAVLSVVAPVDRAAAAVGDLLELMPGRGRLWFWKSVLGTALATSWRHFRAEPLQLILNAAVACIGYMLVVFLLMLAIYPALAVLWLSGDVLANHAGFERLAVPLGLSGDWAEPPPALLKVVQFLVMFVAAPYLAGSRVADLWQERAVALTMTLVVVWSLMLALAPLGAYFGHSVRVPMVVSIIPFMLAGAVRRRLMTVHRSHPPVAG
jgi:hypothetical protein